MQPCPAEVDRKRVAIVGGGGHVGLPFGLLLCDIGHTVTLVDPDAPRLAAIRAGRMPFLERGADELLARCLKSGRLLTRSDAGGLAEQEVVILTIGTPVDEYLDPSVRQFDQVMQGVLEYMRDGQLLIIRSTVFPGVTDRLGRRVAERGPAIDIAYCPERIAEGHALEELTELPQLVSGVTESACRRAEVFFSQLGAKVIQLSTVEAELAKLFTNSYRYINFAISNQFYMMAERFGADFMRIHAAVTTDYPRMRGFARSGFTGGPCLLKDTMQLASFNHNLFALGQTAMMVNEGLPSFLVERLRATRDLARETVGILGMAFKGDCDDPRSSLSYKLRKILLMDARRVVCTDPYIADPEFLPLDEVLEAADILVLGACHKEYRDLKTDKPIVDVFGFLTSADNNPKSKIQNPKS
ncbi:MAG: nucleotide sugar dehydrogenase [Pirellulales bacterium]|nr:nucleotide sugar dehydrogenase [Pirellulales bacterium]